MEDDERSRLAAEWDAVAAAPPPSSAHRPTLTATATAQPAATPSTFLAVGDDLFSRITYPEALGLLAAADMSAHAAAVTVRDERAAGLVSMLTRPPELKFAQSEDKLAFPFLLAQVRRWPAWRSCL